jgi:hypothetical protein
MANVMIPNSSARCLAHVTVTIVLVGRPDSQVVKSLGDRPRSDVGACARPLASAQSLG